MPSKKPQRLSAVRALAIARNSKAADDTAADMQRWWGWTYQSGRDDLLADARDDIRALRRLGFEIRPIARKRKGR